MKKHRYFISYTYQSGNNIIGYGNAECGRDNKIQGFKDIADIEEALLEDLKKSNKNADKLIINNIFKFE